MVIITGVKPRREHMLTKLSIRLGGISLRDRDGGVGEVEKVRTEERTPKPNSLARVVVERPDVCNLPSFVGNNPH